jgi:hypothetical protein
MLCSEAILVNQGPTEGHATVLRCKRWSCELCNPFNHRRIKRAAREGKPTTFLTLTCNPAKHETPDEAARALKTAWVNLRRAMARELGIEKPPFIAVFEATKNGWPHLHILMRCKWISQRWISEKMQRFNGAPICDIRYVDNVKKVAAYVAKYISKAPEAFKHCKRWWRSHDYEVDKEEAPDFRRFSPHISEVGMTLSRFCAEKRRAGWEVEMSAHGYAEFKWLHQTIGALRDGIAENMARLKKEGYFDAPTSK